MMVAYLKTKIADKICPHCAKVTQVCSTIITNIFMFIIIGKSTDDDFISKESKPNLAEDAPVNNSYDPDSDSDSDSVTLVSETYSHFFKLSRAKMKRLEEFYRLLTLIFSF